VTAQNFERCLAFVLAQEGGFVDHPKDPGGPTNQGITQRTLDRWNMVHGRPRKDVAAISQDEVISIYREWYWTPAGCPGLEPPLDLILFDTAVNLGVVPAVRLLQRAVWAEEDGIVGPETLGAARRWNPEHVAMTVLTMRRQHYIEKRRSPFLAGWLKRVDRLRTEALSV
jgi:lysozyme family protein